MSLAIEFQPWFIKNGIQFYKRVAMETDDETMRAWAIELLVKSNRSVNTPAFEADVNGLVNLRKTGKWSEPEPVDNELKTW